MEGSAGIRRLRLRYPATCVVCEIALSPGAEAFWDSTAKQATCIPCGGGDAVFATHVGAGRSAAARADALEARAIREARTRWGDHAAVVAAAMAEDDPSIRAWGKGAAGERRLAAFIEREVGDRVIALHDRLIPGTRSVNIDHLFVARTGVWVVDAKAYKGKVERRDIGPPWREENEVWVDGRNQTKLTDGMASQVKAVRSALEPDPECRAVRVHGALCFLESEWSLLSRPFLVRGVTVLYPGALRARLKKSGGLSRERMERVANRLALSLPPASR